MSGFVPLTPGELSARLAPVTPADLGIDLSDRAAVESRFAYAAFSTLVEPGDTDAVVLVAALGAAAALQAIVERWPSARIRDSVAEHDAAAADLLAGRGRVRRDTGTQRGIGAPAERASASRTHSRLDEALERWRPRLSLRTVVHALEMAGRLDATLVTPVDGCWPTGLGDLGDGAPLALWVRGAVAGLKACDRSIALVGARAATGYGEHVVMEAAAGLADRGFAVVSGGAYGIDGAAHRATLASDQTTIAFLAGGVDRLYPAGHTDLLTRIAERGVLVGELPCGSSPTKWRFLQRNRLIAAASRATVVVEAGRRSGSLNTAGHAAAIGRPLGAVPGPVTSPASAGCHRLLQEYGAVCVTNAAEMAELTGIVDPQLVPDGEDAEEYDSGISRSDRAEFVRVLDALNNRTPRAPREIAARAGMSERDVISTLGVLELDARVVERETGWVRVAGAGA
ncbi:MAG: DNA-processing protein DprA [Actinomycetales bacterium]